MRRSILPRFLPSLLLAACAVARAQSPAAEPELVLNLSLELSTEPGNKAGIVGSIVRTHFLRDGDQLEVTQRVSALRKELVGKYSMPTDFAGFNVVSHEMRLGDYRQFITADKEMNTQQAAYRNLFGRQTAWGLLALGWGAERLRIESAGDLAPYLADYVAREGRASSLVPLLGLWSYDRRVADRILPEGHFDQLALEWGTPAGDIPYTKADFQHESHWRFGTAWSAGFAFAGGQLSARGNHLSPLGKRYYGGGTGSVRGYESGSLGPVDASGASMGADRKLTATAEALWHAFSIGPTPIILSLFGDRGRFYAAEGSVVDEMRAGSYGLGVSVPMPFGIARFSFAKPDHEALRTQRFQFEARANWR